MSLRTKLMLSIFFFMVLVFGLLTVNLWLDMSARARAEKRRNAVLVARMVADMVQGLVARSQAWTEEDWVNVGWELEKVGLINGYTVVGRQGETLTMISSNERNPERVFLEDAAELTAAMNGRIDQSGNRLFVPIETASGRRYAARLNLAFPANAPLANENSSACRIVCSLRAFLSCTMLTP